MNLRILLSLGAVLSLAGCAQEGFETAPVTIAAAEGPVVCQLYTPERVLWDRATAHPQAMSREAADALCRAEGMRRLPGRPG